VKPLNSCFVRIFWIFLKIAWRRMHCRQAAHVVAPNFLGFHMICLAVGSDPPGTVFAAVGIFSFWLVC